MNDLAAAAARVEGWTTDEELRWLAAVCSGRALVIELGAWMGRSTIAMAAADRVVSVDTWLGSPGEPDHQRRVRAGLDVRAEWLRNTACVSHRVEAVCGDLRSAEFCDALVSRFRGAADVVFIDASHDEESVTQDIRLAKMLLARGGVLCGHDFNPNWPGVMAAVCGAVARTINPAGSIWQEVSQ